jgi:hypothetical protein
MDLADLQVLFLQTLQTASQRIIDLEIFILGFIFMTTFCIIEGDLHLFDSGDYSMGLLRHLMLLGRNKPNLVV